jgi:protein phosphatase
LIERVMRRLPLAGRRNETFEIAGAMRTHVGLVRAENEDSVAFIAPKDAEVKRRRGVLAVVADGMGGHAAGEVASALTIDTVCSLFYELSDPIPQSLSKCLAAANRVVRSHAEVNPECAGMGTTCTAAVFRENELFLGHVGDSRAYLLRGSSLRQISEDQSLVAKLVREGLLSAAEALEHPDRNVILSAVGTAPHLDAQLWSRGLLLEEDDTVILCSDGLSDFVRDEELSKIVAGRHPVDMCDALIAAALAGGGGDNVSVGVFRLVAPSLTPSFVGVTRETKQASSPDGAS